MKKEDAQEREGKIMRQEMLIFNPLVLSLKIKDRETLRKRKEERDDGLERTKERWGGKTSVREG